VGGKEIRRFPLSRLIGYLIAWDLRILAIAVYFAGLIKINSRFSLLLFFILLYGTFLLMTLDAAQPRRFHTVEPIIFILASSVFSKKKEEIKT
jgi:hypothetical protein